MFPTSMLWSLAICFWMCANISSGVSVSPIDCHVIDLIPSNPIRAFPYPELSWMFSEPCVHDDLVVLFALFHSLSLLSFIFLRPSLPTMSVYLPLPTLALKSPIPIFTS